MPAQPEWHSRAGGVYIPGRKDAKEAPPKPEPEALSALRALAVYGKR